MTRSTGTSGLIFSASPPSVCIALRIAARSTTAGTPVKSCISTRAGTERDFMLELALLQPFRDRDDVFLLDGAAVLVAQQIFQQHLHGIGKPGNSLQTVLLGGGQAVIDVGLAADLEGLLAFEAVERGHVRKSQFCRCTRQGYQNTVSEAGLMACRRRIVCCIKFRAYRIFLDSRRHTDNRAAAMHHPQILHAVPTAFQRARETGKMRLSGRGVRCVRGGREVFSGLDLTASSGEALAVTGANGSGKTSLLRLIAGPAGVGRRIDRS